MADNHPSGGGSLREAKASWCGLADGKATFKKDLPRFSRALAAGALTICTALGGCGILGSYGPPQDHSRFESAALMADRTVLFSFSHYVYRPAEGITAFPDGGIPRYLKDENVLATYQIASGDVRVLRRERNKHWTDGQGRFGIQRSKGSVALVTQGGQLRGDLSKNEFRHWLVDVSTGASQPVEWQNALAERGRETTQMHLVDGRGTLLFETVPLGADARKSREEDAWLWIRTPGGAFVQVAQTSHYERMAGDDLVYWMPRTRLFSAFNIVTQMTRDLPGYRVPAPRTSSRAFRSRRAASGSCTDTRQAPGGSTSRCPSSPTASSSRLVWACPYLTRGVCAGTPPSPATPCAPPPGSRRRGRPAGAGSRGRRRDRWR